MKKLKLEKFKVSKLNGANQIVGGTISLEMEEYPPMDTRSCPANTISKKEDEDVISCVNTSKEVSVILGLY